MAMEATEFADALTARYRRAYRVAWRYLRTPDDVDDAVQDAMLKALTYWNTEVRNIDAWFNSVVYSVCIDALRSQKRRLDPDELDAANDVAERQVDAASLQETIDELQKILTENQWQILTMRADGYSFEEIGAIHGIATNAAKAVAFRGRMRARDWAQGQV